MRLTGVIATACLLTACGGGSTVGDEGAAGVDCLDVRPAVGKAIAKGASGVKIQPGDVAAIRSPDFDEVYFIAMRFGADGGEDAVGVWASNSLTPGGGLMMSVDGYAKQFTEWPDASKTDAAISGADPSIKDAKSCL